MNKKKFINRATSKPLLFIMAIFLVMGSLRAMAINTKPDRKGSLTAKVRNELQTCPVYPSANKTMKMSNKTWLGEFQNETFPEPVSLPEIFKTETVPSCHFSGSTSQNETS